MNAAFEVEGIVKTYGATQALDDVSARFDAGEVHCLLGENGAGKSTLGKIVGGLERPDAGTMRWRGGPVAFANAREAREAGIAIVHQELSLAPDLSVRDNLWLGAERTRGFALVGRRAERDGAREMLAALGLDLDIEAPTGPLPASIQQLIETGKALMLAPRLVVFDEPTVMLGATEKVKLFQVMRRLRDQGVAIVLVTHHIEDVMAVGDRVSVMRNGRLVDTFALDASIDGTAVLERLTGHKRSDAPAHAAPISDDAILQIEQVPRRDGTTSTIRVRRGEIVGFYGVVGCGAETLVRGVVGEADARPIAYRLRDRAHRPTSAAAAMRAGVAYLPAGRARNGVLSGRSILENASIGRLRRFSRIGAIDTARERRETGVLLADYQVKLADIDDPIASLSGGNQQKVLLARTIGAARDVVVLEEPTAGVDIDAKAEIHRLIRRVSAEGTTIVLLSSDLAEAVALCNTIHTMYAGTVVGTHRDPSPHDQAAILFDVLGRRGVENDRGEAASSTTGTSGTAASQPRVQGAHA